MNQHTQCGIQLPFNLQYYIVCIKIFFFSFSSNVHDIESNCILMTQLTKNALVKHNVENTFWQIIIMQPSYNVPCVLQGFNLQASKSCAQ